MTEMDAGIEMMRRAVRDEIRRAIERINAKARAMTADERRKSNEGAGLAALGHLDHVVRDLSFDFERGEKT